MPDNGALAITYADYNDEVSVVRFRLPTMDGTAFDAAITTDAITLMDAIAGITVGLRRRHAVSNEYLVSQGPAASSAAQRELKWLVQYRDPTTFKRYTVELPCADVAALDPDNRAQANIGDAGVVDAFISAFESIARTPDGNVPVVDNIILVGRNT